MYKFNEYVLRRDETSMNPLDYTALRSSGKDGNPESTLVNKVGVPFGLPIAAMSGGLPIASGLINAMRAARSMAYRAAYNILDYLHNHPDLKVQVLNVIKRMADKLDKGSHMGVVHGDGLPTVNAQGHSSTIGEIGAAVWKGITTSAVNMFDTIFGPRDAVVGTDDRATLKFKKDYRVFFQELGTLSPREAFPLLKNFEHVLNLGGTGEALERDIWR